MTTSEIIAKYLELERQMDVQQTLIDTAQAHYDEIMAEQAELATQHLDELTPLRAGQIIEMSRACMTDMGRTVYLYSSPRILVTIEECQMLIVDDQSQPKIAVHGRLGCVCLDAHPSRQISLELQPGRQWRYPTDSTPAVPAVLADTERTLS